MIRLRRVGWGPIPWPGERRREERARARVAKWMQIVREIERRA